MILPVGSFLDCDCGVPQPAAREAAWQGRGMAMASQMNIACNISMSSTDIRTFFVHFPGSKMIKDVLCFKNLDDDVYPIWLSYFWARKSSTSCSDVSLMCWPKLCPIFIPIDSTQMSRVNQGPAPAAEFVPAGYMQNTEGHWVCCLSFLVDSGGKLLELCF